MNQPRKERNISILEFFNQLQLEYMLYELRVKIYPSKADKHRYREILEFKSEKIEDIAGKNDLRTIFNSDLKREEIEKEFLNEFGIPVDMSKRDKYFYYFINSDFSYEGLGVKLKSYKLSDGTAVIDNNGKSQEVDINRIKRIL